ncbi:amino acid deaminase [Georgenia alba]|uniref:Amino acid deaminase n=1 Tax=Georgenia alba TaxID=2233858 RepID=A0ABW2Q9S4_9MICO
MSPTTSTTPVPAWHDALGEHLITPDPLDKNYRTGSVAEHVGDLPTPSFTLDVQDVRDNLAAMRDWTDERGLLLAPHGKTTMSPGLWHWQLASGAWGITVANAFQLRVARAFGVPRVLVANELVDPAALAWLAAELGEDFDVTCWADSTAAVERMDGALRAAGAERPVGVCVEVGAVGARTGARAPTQARDVARAVHESEVLELRGVAGYEGSIHAARPEDQVGAVRGFLATMRQVFVNLADLYEVPAPILTAGGSQYFDLVAEELDGVSAQVPGAQVVLRSGAYLVHDHVRYAGATPAATRSGPVFRGAARVWSRVLSVPEPGLALVDAGKRDVPYDAGLPTVLSVRRGTDRVDAAARVVDTNDQHGYLTVESGTLEVGDVLELGLSHPCTMFDKWRTVVLVEDERVVGALRTFF